MSSARCVSAKSTVSLVEGTLGVGALRLTVGGIVADLCQVRRILCMTSAICCIYVSVPLVTLLRISGKQAISLYLLPGCSCITNSLFACALAQRSHMVLTASRLLLEERHCGTGTERELTPRPHCEIAAVSSKAKQMLRGLVLPASIAA